MPEPFRPDLAEFSQILRDYALQGVKDYKQESESIRGPIRKKLQLHVEENKESLEAKFARLGRGEKPDFFFIPAPKVDHTDFKFAFFKPMVSSEPNDGSYRCKFHILFWVDRDGGKLMAARMEPPDPDDHSHSYAHIQFTRSIKIRTSADVENTLLSDQEHWLPQSYPGYALGYRHPFQFFAGLAIAIHGYARDRNLNRYVRKVSQRCFPASQHANRARKVMDEIDRKFG